MSIRPATFSDIPKMTALLQDGYERSKYVDRGRVDAQEAKQLLLGAVQRMEVRGVGGACVYVAEKDGELTGLIVGMTERVYHIGDRLRATDLFFYTKEDAPKVTALALMKAFEAWATSNRKVIEIVLGVTDIVGDPERLARVYEKRGYARCGVMLERRIDN